MTPVAVWAGPTGERRDLPATLRVVEALPGLPGHDEFVLDPLDDIGVLFALRSTAPAPIRLFVVSPRAFFPDYAPPLDPEVVAALAGAAGSQGSAPDPAVLVIVHPAQDDEPPTANLLAPLVVDAATGAAVQTVLEGSQWPLRAPLVAPAA